MSHEWWMHGRARVPEHCCAVCGKQMDAVEMFTNGRPDEPPLPKAGDLSVCSYCMAIGIWEADGTVRAATSEECEGVPDWVRHQIVMALRHGKPS